MIKNNILKTALLSFLFLALLGVYFLPTLSAGNFLIPSDIYAQYDSVFRVNGYTAYNNLSSDLALQFLPYRAVAQQSIVPTFWNPYSVGGLPFFEDIQARSFELTNLLADLARIPLQYFFMFSAAALLLFAGLSMFFFIKELQLFDSDALFAGIAYMFSSPIIIWINYSLGTAFLWLPFLCLCIEKIFHGKKIFLPLLSIAVCFLLFAGHPQAAIINLAFVAMYSVYAFLRNQKPKKVLILFIVLFLLLGIGLSAVQTLPAYSFIKQSDVYTLGRSANHGELLATAKDQAAHFFTNAKLFGQRLLLRAVFLVAPNHFGSPVARNYHYPEKPLSNNFFETTSYAGIATVLLALAALFFIRKRSLTFWVVSAAVAFAFFANLPFFNLFSLLPIINKVNLGRLTFIFIFAAIVLAAYGFHELQKIARKKISSNKIFYVLVILVIASVFVDQTVNFTSLVDRHDYPLKKFADNDIVAFLQGDPTARFIALGKGGGSIKTPLIPNQSMMYRIDDLRGYFVMIPGDFFQLANRYLNRQNNYYFASDIINRNFLNIYGVKYIICEKDMCGKYTGDFPVVKESANVQILLNAQALPRAYISYAYRGYTGMDQVFSAFDDKGFDVSKVSLVKNAQNKDSQTPKSAASVRNGKDSISISATAVEDGVLVVSSNYYPGWKATVNGTPTDVLTIDGALMGVRVAKGANDVVFTYRPRLFTLSLIISLVSFFLMLAFSYFILRRPKKMEAGNVTL